MFVEEEVLPLSTEIGYWRKMDLTELDELILYGLYKQALKGDSNSQRSTKSHFFGGGGRRVVGGGRKVGAVPESQSRPSQDSPQGEEHRTLQQGSELSFLLSSPPKIISTDGTKESVSPRRELSRPRRRRRVRVFSRRFSKKGLARQKIWNAISQMVPDEELQQAFGLVQQAMLILAKATQFLECQPCDRASSSTLSSKSLFQSDQQLGLMGIAEVESADESDHSGSTRRSCRTSKNFLPRVPTFHSYSSSSPKSQYRQRPGRKLSAFFNSDTRQRARSVRLQMQKKYNQKLQEQQQTTTSTTTRSSLSMPITNEPQDSPAPSTPVQRLMQAVKENDERAVRALLMTANQSVFRTGKGGPQYAEDLVHATDDCGQTALHVAANHGHANLVRILIGEFGANVAAADHDGISVLQTAVIAGHCTVCQCLLQEFGADPDQEDFDGDTPRLCALDEDSDAPLRQLMEDALPKGGIKRRTKKKKNKKKTAPTPTNGQSSDNQATTEPEDDGNSRNGSDNGEDEDDESSSSFSLGEDDDEYEDDGDPDENDSFMSWRTDFTELKTTEMVVDQVPSEFAKKQKLFLLPPPKQSQQTPQQQPNSKPQGVFTTPTSPKVSQPMRR